MSVFTQCESRCLRSERQIQLRPCYRGGHDNIGVPLMGRSSQELGIHRFQRNIPRGGSLTLVRSCTCCRGTFFVKGTNDIFINKNNPF